MECLIVLAGCLAAFESKETVDTAGVNFKGSNETFNATVPPTNIDEQLDRMPSEITIPSAVLMTLLSCVAFVGNVLTIYSFIKDARLRTVYDMYILNLTIADLCIACVSIPVYVVYSLNAQWPFGRFPCKAWLAADFTFCMVTVIMIMIISLDRLLYIRLGIQYTTRVTSCVAKLQIAASWVLAFLVYSPAIMWWDVWVGYSTVKETECHVEFAYDFSFTAATAVAEFFVPAFVLTLINGAIYRDIRMLIKRRVKIAPDTMDLSNICATARPSGSGCHVSHWSHTPRKIKTHVFRYRNSYDLHNAREMPKFDLDDNCIRLRLSSLPGDIRFRHLGDSWCRHKNAGDALKTKTQTRGFLKAARSLALLVVMFIVCWAPYTILTVVLSFCGNSCINPILYEFFYWWLWVKSAVNPFLYAYNNSRYRSNFQRALTYPCREKHR